MSEAQKGRKHSPESKARMSEAKKGSRYIRAGLIDQVEAILDPNRTTRQESATSPNGPKHTIRLGGPGEPTFIDGSAVKPLTRSQHKLIDALLEAGTDGMSSESYRIWASGAGGNRCQSSRGAICSGARSWSSPDAPMAAIGFWPWWTRNVHLQKYTEVGGAFPLDTGV